MDYRRISGKYRISAHGLTLWRHCDAISPPITIKFCISVAPTFLWWYAKFEAISSTRYWDIAINVKWVKMPPAAHGLIFLVFLRPNNYIFDWIGLVLRNCVICILRDRRWVGVPASRARARVRRFSPTDRCPRDSNPGPLDLKSSILSLTWGYGGQINAFYIRKASTWSTKKVKSSTFCDAISFRYICMYLLP